MIKVTLYTGEISSVPADVVCSSTNPNLELIAGTGAALRTYGGQAIQEECNKLILEEKARSGRRWLAPGSVTKTCAGTLPYSAIIHCVAIDAFHGSSPDVIANCASNALDAAIGVVPSPKSLAMPVFASGHGQFDFETSLRTMLGVLELRKHEFNLDVLIVVRDSDQIEIARGIIL
ncbi:macro domain-containing protein [Candidatus Sumerlaeota bacterium]|nr:macro domain-containing protein [Candidatus Sumerlaeota bacterium]